MLLSKHNLIFIHPPKTAGNTIQSVLFPHSDDKMIADGFRDGHDRFEVRGFITSHKHMTLNEYAEKLGERFKDFRVAMSVRNPIERAVSMYFSPHRWFRQVANGGYALTEPAWSRDEFYALIEKMPSLTDFATFNGAFRKPDYIIRQEHFAEDFAAFCRDVGLPDSAAPGRRNKSAGDAPFIRELLRERALKNNIREQFAVDFENFDY